MTHFALPASFAELTSLSVTEVTSGRSCGYEIVLARATGNTPPLLPHPAALLGSAIHKVVASIQRNELRTRQAVGERFDELVEAQEAELRQQGFGYLVPLMLRARQFRLLRARLRCLLPELNAPTTPASAVTNQWQQLEKLLYSTDGQLKGRPDSMREVGGQVEIVEYKSGSLHKEDGWTVQENYMYQLLLYAFLYAQTYRRWPDKLTLSGLNGQRITVDCIPEECTRLAEQARCWMTTINQHIRQHAAMQLARPEPTGCQYCRYRPFCELYRALLPHADARDLVGRLHFIEALSGGGFRLLLECRSQTCQVVTRTHAESELPAVGEEIELYGLKPMSQVGHFETYATTFLK